MADISITPANVVPGTGCRVTHGIAGETIVAGKALYKAAVSGKWMLADADSATVEARNASGIALNGASLNQPVSVAKLGDVTLGAVLTAGVAYYLSGAAAGGICPVADIGTGEWVSLLGIAKTTSILAVNPQFPGVAL